MQRYIVRRLLLSLPALFGVSVIIFVSLRVLPGDPAIMVLVGPGGTGSINPEELARLRRELGTDRPILEQYGKWIGDVARLELGKSLKSNRPVAAEIGPRLRTTMELALMTILVSLLIAIPSGVISAVRQDTWVDYAVRVVTVAGVAVPPFWTGILLVIGLVNLFNWMPPLGFKSIFQNPVVGLQQIIWPALALAYFQAAAISRMTRSCMLEVLRQDYIRTAWSKGLREHVVIYRHALRNSVLPVLTTVGLQFGSLLSGAVVVELVFVLPGLGTSLVESILFRDYPMVQVIILLFSGMYLLVNLVVDLMYGWMDPRIRLA